MICFNESQRSSKVLGHALMFSHLICSACFMQTHALLFTSRSLFLLFDGQLSYFSERRRKLGAFQSLFGSALQSNPAKCGFFSKSLIFNKVASVLYIYRDEFYV